MLKAFYGEPFAGFMGAAPKSLRPVDLRRPKIPKAGKMPRIPGPRGGPAYRPHPQDSPTNDNDRRIRKAYATATLDDHAYMHPVMPLTLACGFAIGCAQVLGIL